MSTSPTPAAQPAFNPFAGMAALSSSTSAETPPDDGYVPPIEVDAKGSQATAEVKKDDEEEDLVIGEQLDSVSAPSASTASPPFAETPSNSVAPANEDTGNFPAADSDTAGPEIASSEEDANEVGGLGGRQMDPRMAQQLAAQAAERAGQRPGGSGGGSPGLSGLVMAGGSAISAGIGGTFKMLGNGVKAVRGYSDPSLPKPMTVGERIAMADPVKAETYYRNAGDKVVREKLYRDAFEGMNASIAGAREAERAFQDGVGEMREVLANSDVKALAEAAGTSVGDYIHSVKSGTIQDAAAQAIVQTLEQSSDFKAAEEKIVSAGTTFAEKKDAALAKMATIETSFPDRADTSIKKQQLSDLADRMKGDDVSKASAKVKKIMDEIEAMANALKEAIRKALDKVASIFQPK
ncbi:hypothetical protein GOB57_08590 [Sinorhizobium meliloti]|nr:hypothetical protein [Sinorhizobium meliloti]